MLSPHPMLAIYSCPKRFHRNTNHLTNPVIYPLSAIYRGGSSSVGKSSQATNTSITLSVSPCHCNRYWEQQTPYWIIRGGCVSHLLLQQVQPEKFSHPIKKKVELSIVPAIAGRGLWYSHSIDNTTQVRLGWYLKTVGSVVEETHKLFSHSKLATHHWSRGGTHRLLNHPAESL
jgi:hypothetical protein